MSTETRTLIRLLHPDPFINPKAFIDSLPDDFIRDYFYTSKEYSIEEKKSRAVKYFLMLNKEEVKNSAVLSLLEDYYVEKTNE